MKENPYYMTRKNFIDIQKELTSHVNNKNLFRTNQISSYEGVTFFKDNWSSRNMRRFYFSCCNFNEVNFKSTGFTAAIFLNCNFNKSILDFTIFDECYFVNCKFSDMNLTGSSFCKSEFENCNFKNMNLNACFYTDASFNNFCFENCTIIDIIWEKAKFNNVLFSNTILKKLNFEFTFFINIKFYNTVIPFGSIPYIFGGIDYLKNTNDDVFIKTVNPNYKDGKMSKDEYLDLLPDLISFYKETNNYFPLANILLALKRKEEGLNAIRDGIKFWTMGRNYKLVYYISLLVDIFNLNIEDRKLIYEDIEKINYSIINDNSELNNRWNNYFYKIRDILLNSHNCTFMTMDIKTKIDQSDYYTLGQFLDIIDKLFFIKNGYYKVEIRHNSPFEILYTFFATSKDILEWCSFAITIFVGCHQIYSNHLANKLNKAQIKNIESNKKEQKIDEKSAPQFQDIVINNTVQIQYNLYNVENSYFTAQSKGCENPDSSGNNQ